MTPHNTAEKGQIASTCLMPGDPLRAKFIAENFLENPVMNFILVDHNESEQSIPGIEETTILEIVDHHRIAMQKTKHLSVRHRFPVSHRDKTRR